MGLRIRRGARLRRAPLGGADVAGLVVALYTAAGAAVTWPALRHADTSFLALRQPGHGEAAAGDHLQVTYQLWLFGHRVAHLAAPWIDPYSFRPATDGVAVFQGWLFGLPLWPVFAAAGPVAAWNVLVLGSYALAGGLAYGWLRSLGVPRGAAAAGGLVFCVFPFRVAQSTGHLLGPISALLPGVLWAIQRRRFVLAAAVLTAIPLSGQLHLALGAIPLAVAYGLARRRSLGSLAAAVPAVAAGWAVSRVAVEGTIAGSGRTLRAVSFFSPDWQDAVLRELRHPPPIAPEFVVFMGWLTPVVALAGLVLLLRQSDYALAGLLGLTVAIPVWLALGTNLPSYGFLWEHFSPLRYPRVPERLLPIAGLAVAALVATVLERWSRPLVVALALVVLFLDLRIPAYDAAAADPGNRTYEAARGRVLELPVFAADRHWNSVYLYYGIERPGQRVGGYSTTAPPEAAALLNGLVRLNCGVGRVPRDLGIRSIVVHRGLYRATPLVGLSCLGPAEATLRRQGWRVAVRDGPVVLYSRR